MSTARRQRERLVPIMVLAGLVAACTAAPDVSPLRAQKAQLERELEGLRESVALVESGKSIFPGQDVAIGIDQGLVSRLITAGLPFTANVAPYTLVLDRVEVGFMGAATLKLRGRVTREGVLTLNGAATVLGSLTDISIDPATSTLAARISLDHLDIEQAAGIEALVSGSTLDDVANGLRVEANAKIPRMAIPVKLQQNFDLPAITTGPVRLSEATLPVGARVSRVFATEGVLWVGIHLNLEGFGGGS